MVGHRSRPAAHRLPATTHAHKPQRQHAREDTGHLQPQHEARDFGVDGVGVACVNHRDFGVG